MTITDDDRMTNADDWMPMMMMMMMMIGWHKSELFELLPPHPFIDDLRSSTVTDLSSSSSRVSTVVQYSE